MNERIKKLRKVLNLTQQEFGECIGMKRNSIALIEGGRNTSDQTIFAICREFNVNEKWLRTGEGSMFIEIPEEDMYSKAAASLLIDDDALAIEGIKLYYSLRPEEKKIVLDFILQLSDRIRNHNENQTEHITNTSVEASETAYIKSRSKNIHEKGLSALDTTEKI